MFPVRIIEIYWSAVARFRNKPEATVAATVLASLCVKTYKHTRNAPQHATGRHSSTQAHGTENQPYRIHHTSHATGGNQFGQCRSRSLQRRTS